MAKGPNIGSLWVFYNRDLNVIFHLDERYSLKPTVLESGQKSINWVSVDNFEALSRPYS